MAYFLTRIKVPNYDAWKPNFDSDDPGASRSAKGHRLFRNVDDPNEVFILVEFASADEAKAGRARLLDSGVLDRFENKSPPVIIEEAEAVAY